MLVGAEDSGLQDNEVATRLGMAIVGIGRGAGFVATGAEAGVITAFRLAATAAGNTSKRSVSVETATCRAPLDFNSSRCVIVASSS